MRVVSFIGLSLLVLVLVAPVDGAGLPFAYRFAAGDRFVLKTVSHADAPVVGPVDTWMEVKAHVLSTDGGGMQLEQEVAAPIPMSVSIASH